MTERRKISDDELVEITGGADGPISDLEPGMGSSRLTPGSAGGPVRIPGGGVDPEAEGGSSSGSSNLF